MDNDKEVEMEEGIAGNAGSQADDKERLLEEFEAESTALPVEKSIKRWLLGLWTKYRTGIWMPLAIFATLTTRRSFRGPFPYPLYFMFIAQLIANSSFAVWSVYTIIQGFRESRSRGKEWRFGTSPLKTILHGLRLLIHALISAIGLLFGAHALFLYPNFHALAFLPVFSFVCDSFLLHIASVVRLRRPQKPFGYFDFLGVLLVIGGVLVIVLTDYRLEAQPVCFALAGLFLESFSRAFLMIRPEVQEQREQSKTFFIFERMMVGIPQLVVSGIAASHFENTIDAAHRLKFWSSSGGFATFLPAVLLLVFFGTGLNSAYRSPMTEEHISVLEDGGSQAKTALQVTLHASYLILAIGAFSREFTLLNWFQAVGFASIYVIALGPVQVGYYPLNLHNWAARLVRLKQRHVNLKSWRLLWFLLSCTLIVWALLSCGSVYWVNTMAYNRSAKSFKNPSLAHIDFQYFPPKIREIEVVIAHSNDHPHKLLFEMTEKIRKTQEVMRLGPYIKIYTKDPTLLEKAKERDKDDFHIELLPDIGGPAATYLHHIVTNWDKLRTQTVFLSSSKSESFDPFQKRIQTHFAGQGFPLADAEPKTGFLSLGDSQTCQCNDCYDSFGWEDTFSLIPSMWSAVRPNQTSCDSVLLTYSNNFIVSAARIRGIDKDIWELLYDGLTAKNFQDSWAHEKGRLPQMLPGEKKMGRWGPGGVYEDEDSAEKPVMGKTLERLWGVLMQCSTSEIAWRCPSLKVTKRFGGEKADCGCIDDLVAGFL